MKGQYSQHPGGKYISPEEGIWEEYTAHQWIIDTMIVIELLNALIISDTNLHCHLAGEAPKN